MAFISPYYKYPYPLAKPLTYGNAHNILTIETDGLLKLTDAAFTNIPSHITNESSDTTNNNSTQNFRLSTSIGTYILNEPVLLGGTR